METCGGTAGGGNCWRKEKSCIAQALLNTTLELDPLLAVAIVCHLGEAAGNSLFRNTIIRAVCGFGSPGSRFAGLGGFSGTCLLCVGLYVKMCI